MILITFNEQGYIIAIVPTYKYVSLNKYELNNSIIFPLYTYPFLYSIKYIISTYTATMFNERV